MTGVLTFLGLLVLLVAVVAITIHNRLARLFNHIRESWSNVDVQLKRRYNLIPSMVETAKAYASHEQKLFEEVTKARNTALQNEGELKDQEADENRMVQHLNLLMARLEAYPELKSDAHFLNLQRELANTEDRIAAARRFYNANVRAYNVMLEAFPSSVIAKQQGRRPYDYFEIDQLEIRRPPALGL